MRRLIVPAAAALLLASGCSGSSSAAICLTGGSGEICADQGANSVQFTTDGLEPGSQVSIVSTEGDQAWTVGPEGSVEGTIAFMAARPRAWSFEITAISADGETITGTVDFPVPEASS